MTFLRALRIILPLAEGFVSENPSDDSKCQEQRFRAMDKVWDYIRRKENV